MFGCSHSWGKSKTTRRTALIGGLGLLGTSDQITAYTAEVKLGSASILRSAFANNQFGLNAVDLPSITYADPNHRWGLAPFHYTPDVYRHVIDQLRAEGYRV